MTALSDYLEPALLNLTLRGVAFTAVAAPYVSLHSASPADTGAAELVPGANAYVRKAATFAAPVATGDGGWACSLSAQLQWTNMPAATVSHVGIWDALTAGNLLYAGALINAETVPAAATYTINAGDITVELR